MTDPMTIVAIITGVASAIVAIASGIHYKIRMKCCMCCETDCIENETQREIKKINKNNFSVSSIKSI